MGCVTVRLMKIDLTRGGQENLTGTRICKEISLRKLRRRMQTRYFPWALVLLRFYGMLEDRRTLFMSRL